MVRLLLVEDRAGVVDALPAQGLSFVPVHETNPGLAFVRLASSGLLTVDLALPGHAGYRCVSALSGGAPDIPVLMVSGCDQAVHEQALGARLRAFVRRDRAIQLAPVAGWPSTLGVSSREFDRLMAIVRRCGRVTMDPERGYVLTVRAAGFLVHATASHAPAAYSDAWHAIQFAVARAATLERRAIA